MNYSEAKILCDSIDIHDQRITTMELFYPLVVHSEMLRHCKFANSVACVSGDTEIVFDRPSNVKKGVWGHSSKLHIKDIYERWNKKDALNSHLSNRFKKMFLRSLNEETGEFYSAHIKNIYYSGIKHVYEIKLENGYKIKCTKDHKLFTNNGWETLETLGRVHTENNIVIITKVNIKLATSDYIEQLCNTTENKPVCRFSDIVSVSYIGKEDTYDIEVDGKFNNFVGNGIVVHNSNRAIPLSRNLENIENKMYIPFDLRKNQSGMQGFDHISDEELEYFEQKHKELFDHIKEWVVDVKIKTDLHKQTLNRYLHEFQYVRHVITSTEFSNFFNQRIHKDADPAIQSIAKLMKIELENSVPKLLKRGEYHSPYLLESEQDLDIYTKLRISVARIARTSYDNFDGTRNVDKDLELYYRLLNQNPPHYSPFEHVVMCTELKAERYFEPYISFDSYKYHSYYQKNIFDKYEGWMSLRFKLQNNIR